MDRYWRKSKKGVCREIYATYGMTPPLWTPSDSPPAALLPSFFSPPDHADFPAIKVSSSLTKKRLYPPNISYCICLSWPPIYSPLPPPPTSLSCFLWVLSLLSRQTLCLPWLISWFRVGRVVVLHLSYGLVAPELLLLLSSVISRPMTFATLLTNRSFWSSLAFFSFFLLIHLVYGNIFDVGF